METLTKRSTKGSALTFGEMDGNWDKIAAGVAGVETQVAVSLNPDGTIRDQKVPYAATSNATDSYAAAITGTFAALSDLAGRVILILVDVPNTGPATLTVNGTLTDNILKQGGQALASGDIKAGVNAFMWDATSAAFLMVNAPGTNSPPNFGVTTNSSNDYTITVSSLNGSTFEVPAAYYAGYTVYAKINSAVTGAMRLKVAVTTPAIDLGFADVKKYGSVAIDSGDLAANQIYKFVHDGTNFQFIGHVNNEATRKFTQTGIAIPTSAGNLAAPITHGLGGIPDVVYWKLKNKGNVSGQTHGYSVGDCIDIRGCSYTADVYQVFIPIITATQLDLAIEGLGSIVERNGGTRQSMSLTELGQDFDLEVTAIRFST
jgi:hypothetical protein